eukprot:6772654-Prymnesium_polylepis.1
MRAGRASRHCEATERSLRKAREMRRGVLPDRSPTSRPVLPRFQGRVPWPFGLWKLEQLPRTDGPRPNHFSSSHNPPSQAEGSRSVDIIKIMMIIDITIPMISARCRNHRMKS